MLNNNASLLLYFTLCTTKFDEQNMKIVHKLDIFMIFRQIKRLSEHIGDDDKLKAKE